MHVQAEALQKVFGSPVWIEGVKLPSNVNRRLQGSVSDIEILYTVQCKDECAKLQSTIKNMNTKNMDNVIAAINEHATNTGFSTVVHSTGAEVAANIPSPTFVDIIVPSCPPGMESLGGSMTRIQLIQSGSGSCVDTDGCKNSPCGKGSLCTDIAAPDMGFK